MNRRFALLKLSAKLSVLALLTLPVGYALWAQTPPDTDPPQIQILESGTALTDGRLFNRAATPLLQASDASGATVEATLDGSAYTSGTAVSGEGTHLLSVTATDGAGNSATLAVGFEIDTTPPAFLEVLPAGDSVIPDAQVTLQGQVTGAATVTVDGQPATLAGQDFTAGPYTLAEGGLKTWTIVAADAAGNSAQRTHKITRDSQAPTVAISQPAANALLKDASVDVVGSAQDPRLTGVTVNGTAATLTGSTWVARQVPLAEGSNSLLARAEDRAGNSGQATRAVVRDSQAPSLAITDPAPGTVVPGASITLKGTASDPHLDRVEVNGVRAVLTGEAWSLAMNLVDGANDFTVRAFDRVSNSAQETLSVTRDSDAPAVRITQPGDGVRLSAQTVTVSGTVDNEAGLTVTVNGVAAAVTGGTFSAGGITLVEGENTLIARARDAVGNQGTHTRIVLRDTVAPKLVSADPASGALALPVDAAFRLTFSEDMAHPAAGSVRLETGAGQSLGTSASRVGSVVTVRSLDPLPSSTQVRLVLTAGLTDVVGNPLAQPSTLTFFTVDTTAPAAPVLAPAPEHVVCAPVLVLAGTAEAGAVVRVEGGAARAEGRADETGHFSVSVQLSPGGLNRLRATATDSAGNASAETLSEVVHDCQAPRVVAAERQGELFLVTFSEPVQAASLAGAVKLSGVSGPVAGVVSLSGNGLTATFDPAGVLPAGALRLEVTTAVRDAGGTAMAYPWSQVFGAQGGSGFLLGTVIDNTTGRPLAGARVLVFASNGTPLPEPLPEQVTAEDGRFRLPVPAGTHDLTIVRPGYTPAFRIVTTGAGQGTDVFDPRLTPSAKPRTLGAAGGVVGSVADGEAVLTLPAGALAAPVAVAATRLDEQGLPALLPYGWSPRAAVWLDLGAAALLAESTLSLPSDAPSGSTLTLVHLDLAALQWRVLGSAQVAGGRVGIALPVAAAGLADGGYAAVQADTGALAPPAPVAGAVLGGSAHPAGDEPTAATMSFNPEVVLPSQSSLATAVYTLSEPAASGLPLTLLIEEELTLLDNSVRRQTPYQADLILYHAPDGTPRSRFQLRPSASAQTLPLKLGAEDVTLRTYGGEAVSGNVVGPEGGTVTGADGDRIDLPAGAVTEPTAIVLTRKAAADLGLPVPAGTALDGVLHLDLNGQRLLVPGALSLALNPAPAAGDKGLLLQVIELESGRAFRAVAALQATATGWTTAAIDPQDLAWPGVREEGLYAFVRLTGAFGSLRGTVSDVGGLPLAGAVVRATGVTWVQLSNAGGTYALPVAAGTVTATAENRLTGNQGSAQAEVVVDARVDLNLSLQPVGPRVVQITPADGAVDVIQGVQPTVRFSEPVAPASVTGAIQLLSEGQPVAVDLEVQGALVRVKPRSALLPATAHELRVTSGVRDLQGNSLESPEASQFTTLRVLLTNDIDLTRVFLVEPGANGQARVLGKPGAVPAGALVFVENRNALVTTPSATAGQDGGFDLNIEATFAHTLILHVLIPGSNEIVAKLTPFHTPDLKGAYVDDKAVIYTTGDGVKVMIAEGTFTGPAVVRLEPKPLTELAAPVPSGFAAVYNFSLDFSGAQARKALQISVPKPAGAPEAVEGVYLLNRAIEALGKRYWMMHDIMRLDAATGRLTTELPAAGTAAAGVQEAAVVASLADPFMLAAAQTTEPPVYTAKSIVRQYKSYVTGSAFPGQYQVAASQIPLGFTIFPSFDMNFQVGIWNLGMEGMATRIDAGIAQLLEGDGIMIPTRRHQPYKLVVRDLTTGFRLYENTFAAPTSDEPISLPPDVYGDTVPPAPAGGTPVRFIPLNFSGPSELQIDLGIKAQWANDKITITGEVDSTQSEVEIRLIGLDDNASVTATSNATGAFTLESPGKIGKRYLLAIGARIPSDRPLEINFSEALSEDFAGIEVVDASGNMLHPAKVPVGTRATVQVSLRSGWRADKEYTLRLDDQLADGSGNTWDHLLEVQFEVFGSDTLGTFQIPAVRDIARLGSWLFVAADSTGLLVMDASDPAHLRNVLPNNLGFPFPLADPVRGVAVDPHGRVLVAGGGVTGPGQLKIFDPLAMDIQAITEHPNDVSLRFAAFKGSTIISDKLGGTGTQLPSGTPRRVAILSNDKTNEWKLGDPAPADLQVTPTENPGGVDDDFEVTVTGTDGTAGRPVMLQDLTRGRWHRIDAGANGHYTIKLQVQEGDRLRLLRNQDSIAYVATTGVGLEVVDVNAFYNEDHNFVHSDIRGTYSGFKENLTLCGQPVADIGTAFTDLDTLFDPANLNPVVVVGLVGQRGFLLLRSNPASVGEVSLLNQECTDVEGSTAISALAVLQHYIFDLDGDGELESTEGRDYILVAHQKGGILIYDVTDREEIRLVGRIRMPGQVSQLSVDREGRRLYVAGAAAGFYIVDLDAPPSKDLLDVDHDGKDDRILETIALPGNTNTNVRLVPELGLAFAGGLNRGLTSLAVGHPQLDVLARGSDGRYRKINRVAPFGVPTAKESSDPESPDIPGSFRLLASLPGLVGDQVKLDVTGGLGPAALGETACLLGEEPEIVLHRMANKPWEPGYQLYLSNQIAVLADPRASRRYQRTPKETEECVRCDLDEEEVPEDAVEVMSGDFVNVMFPQELREQLLDVYSKDRIDASELRLSSVRWDLVPPVEQEPAQNPCLVAEAPGLLGCTGEMTHSTTDLGVRGLGFDFVLRRFYRSQSIGMGPFGPGWDHNYNQRLRKLPNGDVEYYDGMGRRETFTVQEGGTLKSPPGRFASLEHVSSGWIMLDAQHNATRFDEYGRLTSIADAVKDSKDTGNEMTFFYDAKSRLVRVKDTTDRDILFEYREQACGEISKITDFDGREFLYEYDDKNRLVNFKTPIVPTVLAVGDPTSLQTEPLETRYTYDEGSGNLADVLNGQDNLTSVKDPKGQSWLNVSYGDTNGDQRQNEVAGQSWGGGNIQVQYDFGGHQATLTDPRGQQFSYTFSEKGQVKEIRDPAGASATFTYDDEGLVATRTDPNGRVTTYAYDAPCANPPIGERRSRGNLTSISVTPDDHGPNGSSSPLVTCTDYEGYSNQPVQIVDPRGTVTLVSRNEVGLPIAITQAAGTPDASTVQTSYNERGQPLLSVNPNGNTIQYLYNRLGYPAGMVADSHGLALVTRFETDQRGNVIAMIDPRGVGFTRAYNALNWIVETHRAVTGAADVEGAPALNYTTTYLHDANGNVIEERLPYGDGSAITRRAYIYGPVDELLQSFAQETPGQPFLEWPTTFRFYDSNRNLVKIVEPAGQVTEFTYDSRNILSSVIRGAGTEDAVTEHHAYDLEGKKISYQDGRGGTWTTAYDGYGRVSRTVDAVGNIATVSYDNGSNPITTGVYQGPVQAGDDPVLMAQKGAQYDRLNRPKAITQKLWEYGSNTEPRDLTSRFEYDAASNLKKITDPLNRIATSEYDHAERLVATVDPMGNRLERDLDKAGNPLTTRSIEVQPAGAGAVTVTTQATYDALGRLSTATDALGNVNKLFYDARNNLRISIDPESFVTERTYDGLDRLTRQIQPEGISVDYGYDKSSRLVSYQDALSQKTTYSYDVLNRRTGVTYPDGKHESYRYDASHNPRQITDANGSTIQQTFDAANRLTGRSVGLGSGVIGTTSEVYTYDALNRMTRAQSGTVVTELTFNPLSRMVRERTAGREVTYQYDDVGNPTRLEYPSGFALRQTFDALNRPTTIGQVNGTAPGAPFDEAVSYAYRGQGLVVTKTLGNGLTGNDQYDAVRRLLDETFKTATGQTVFRESLAWTPRSLKVTQSRGDLNGEGFLFGYDGAGRLTQAGKALNPALANNSVAPPQDFANLPDAFGYTYDKAQNLLVRTEKDDGVAKAVALPLDGSGRNRPASVGPVALEWDSNGNMIRKGDLRFQYDYRNRLARVSRANGEEVATYQYDAFNRRIAKVVAGETRETTWRGWQPVEERRNGDLDQRRVYGLGLDEMVQLQVDLNGDGQADQTYAPIYDSMGNLVLMTGNGGKPIERYEYTPYGERKIFVDSTPPAVEQVRVKGSALWIEISEGVASDALAKAVADHTVKLTNIGNGQEIGIATVTQPVTTGRQARRRLVITTTGPPAAETQVRLTIPAVALRDSFLNQPTADYDLTFSWPQSDAVLQDSQAIRLQSAAIRDGHLEIELSEEPDLATASAIQLDGAGATWTLSDDRYSLRSTAELSAGSHAVTIGPGLTDLNGTSLTTALNESFTVAAHGNQAVFEAPDPRESSASTIGNPFGFKGLQIDPETGLIYARNRYYDPEMGRFVTADPSGYADGPNSYQFGLNSPGNYGDPFGLQALPRPNPFPVFPGPANDNFPLGPRPVPPPSVPPTVKPVPVPGPGPLPYLIAFAVGWDKGREFGTSTQDDGRTGDQRIQDDLSDYMAGARTFDEIATDWFTDALLSKGEQKAANQPIQPNPYTPRSGSGAGEQQTPVFNTDGQVERWLPNLRGGTGSGRANKAPLDKAPYTIHFSVQLSPVDYPGVSDERHFQIANEALYKSFQASPEFAQEMEKQYPGIVAGVAPGARGAFPRRAPTPDTTWHHHPTEEGVVELVPRDEHSGPGSQQEALHPDGRGGMENWGGGRKRGGKKNGG